MTARLAARKLQPMDSQPRVKRATPTKPNKKPNRLPLSQTSFPATFIPLLRHSWGFRLPPSLSEIIPSASTFIGTKALAKQTLP